MIIDTLPNKYKLHYGIREEHPNMVYGFDLFHQVSSHGLDLETALEFFKEHSIDVDWFNFTRTAKKSGWSWKTLMSKVSLPIEYVYSKEVFDYIKQRMMIVYMNEQL